MLYLVVHIISITLFSLCYKAASTGPRTCHTPLVHLNMYLAAVLAAGTSVFFLGFIPDLRITLLGIAGGLCLFAAMRTFFFAMTQGGLAVGWTFVNLSVVIPLVASIYFWNEIPGPYQVAGLVLILPCIMLFGNLDLQVAGNRRRWLVLVFIASAATGLAQTVGKAVSVLEFQDRMQLIVNYLLWFYLVGIGLLVGLGGARNWKPVSRETGVGLIMGGLNVAGVWSFIKALENMEGIVFFPTKTAFNIILTALFAVFFWKEEVTKRQVAGIGVGTLAAVFVNLR